ncbi:MAG: HAMP domain-containing sensor histidine kinase [Pseudomonadota bacterium]
MRGERLGTSDAALGEDALQTRRRMQLGLLQGFYWLVVVSGVGLAVRELVSRSAVSSALFAVAFGAGALLWSKRGGVPLRVQGMIFFSTVVLLITKAALDLGGAAGSALSFGFLPGFLMTLLFGPVWGWPVCSLMLMSFAALVLGTALPTRYDVLRFIDEAVMTLFATGLAHALHHSFESYERAIATRRATLLRLRDKRQAMTQAIYERLEPLSASLVQALAGSGAKVASGGTLSELVRQFIQSLNQAKVLASPTEEELLQPEDPDRTIRSRTMRVWLRLGAGLMAFFALRNWAIGATFAPSIFSFGFCFLFDAWLSRPESTRRLELTALAIGLFATGPMIAYLVAYGAGPDAPALVVMPATVLFTALLSQGPAASAVVGLNVGILAWVGVGRPLPLTQSRLLGDLALSFVVVVVALRSVFALRRRYSEALLGQAQQITEALRQHRRLAGTLFHDVSNHLQVLALELEFEDPDANPEHAQSLSRRTQRLIALSKEFLLNPESSPEPTLASLHVRQALSSLDEAFGPRLRAKQMRLVGGRGLELRVQAQPDLLIESVLGNLLSNAIKFSPPGALITIEAEAFGPEVSILLSDPGPGVPLNVRKRIGQEGALPSQLGTEGEQGQGFGLQLVQEHVQRMGGRVELKDRAGGGTVCVVSLPSA